MRGISGTATIFAGTWRGVVLARIASHLRMRDALIGTADPRGADVIAVGGLRIDTAARRVTLDGEEIAMRPKEFDVLALLGRHAGAVVTREQLIEQVWDENWFGSTKTLDVTIGRLRNKLEEAGSSDRVIAIRGVGFRLEGGD